MQNNISTMTDFVNRTKVSTTLPEVKSNLSGAAAQTNNLNTPPQNNVVSNPITETQQVQTTTQAAGAGAPAQNANVETLQKAPSEDAPQLKAQPQSDTVELNKQLRKAKRKNGLIEKAYDKIKNATGLGIGSKKIQDAINSGKDAKEIGEQIADYRVSQEKSSQTAGDVLSVLAAGGFFFAAKNAMVNLDALKNLKNTDGLFAMAMSAAGKKGGKIGSMGKSAIALAVPAAIIGGLVKYTALKVNRLGSERYQIDKEDQLSKNDLRKERQYLKAEKRSASFKNFSTGAINGLLMPVMSLGGIIGTPIYLAANALSRYFIGENNDEENKTPATFVKSIVKNPITTIAAAALIAIPLFRKGQFSSALVKNTNTVVGNLNRAALQKAGTGESAYQELEKILLGNEDIKRLINASSWEMDVDTKIQKLTEQNIFAVKFEQIKGSQNGGILGSLFGLDCSYEERRLIKALRETCPPSRTVKEAQKLVAKTFGKQYKVQKCLGVGTVAETYLAKDASGNEVCIKMLKKGIDPKKIKDDRKKFLEIIKAHFAKHPEKKDEMEYMIKNMESIVDSVKKEIDFANEMEAAKRLAKHTTKAKVVQPIQVKDGLYVMEKADGVSLESFLRLNDLYAQKKNMTRLKQDVSDIERQIAQVKAKTPAFNDISFDKEDADYLLEQYMNVLVEQFSKTEKGGKTIHGDIHPGNIFINPDALRSKQGQVFTLIDTGNTIEQTAAQAVRAMNLTKYLDNADVENLAKYALDGAKLPKGMTCDKAQREVEKELRRIFFDNKTAIGHMNNDEFTKIISAVMKKLNIVPSDTQGALFKAKQSANGSLKDLRDTIMNRIFGNLLTGEGGLAEEGIGWAKLEAKFALSKSNQEKANLKKLSPADRARIRRSKGTPKRNSVEYLTYKLKQQVKATADRLHGEK